MRDDDDVIIPGRRRPNLLGAMLLSALISAVVSLLTVLSVLRGWPVDLSPLGMVPGAPQAAVASPEARVPDVNGMAAEAADELLAARKLRLVVRDRRADAKVVAGAVIAQTPLAQSRIHPGGEVSVVLSTGPERIHVPALAGQTLEQAKQSIASSGLHLGPISESSEGEAGKVTAVAPEAGTVVDPGTSVALTVGRATVSAPHLVGRHVRDMREILQKAGLEVGRVSYTYNPRKRGNLVLTQDPESGTAVALGSKVDLVVNQGD